MNLPEKPPFFSTNFLLGLIYDTQTVIFNGFLRNSSLKLENNVRISSLVARLFARFVQMKIYALGYIFSLRHYFL